MQYKKYYLQKLAERLIVDPFRIKSPKLESYLCSIKYTINAVFGREVYPMKNFSIQKIVTTCGTFNIRKGCLDIICCLPSYESEDINDLLVQIKKHDNKKTLFVDVGADLGTYCITVANNTRHVDSIAIEPNPDSRKLLKINLKENKIEKRVKIYPNAVSDRSNMKVVLEANMDLPGSSTIKDLANNQTHRKINVKTIKLDDILLKNAAQYDHIYIKMDIERNEGLALKGLSNFLKKHGSKTVFLIEDFLDSSFESILKKNYILPTQKLTPYNRWYSYSNFPKIND
jgi:FkbM family methyltransferase